MDEQIQICPICEELNPPGGQLCMRCGQDLRNAPLRDFFNFTQKPFSEQRKELNRKFENIRNRLNISFEALRFLVSQDSYGKAPRVLDYYKTRMEMERSSASYYLYIFSLDIFAEHYSTLMINLNIYFVLWKTYLTRANLPRTPRVEQLFKEGFRLIEDQMNKCRYLIDDAVSDIKKADDETAGAKQWKYPPPPPLFTIYTKEKRK